MRLRSVLVVVLLAVTSAAQAPLMSAAQAQRRVDIERFAPALDGDGFIGLQGTKPPGPWHYNFGLWLGYSHSPLVLSTAGGDTVDVVADRLVTNLQAQLGITGRLALAIDVPLVMWQSGGQDLIGAGRVPSNAFGDPRLVLRARIVGEDASIERERNEGPGVAVLVSTTLPVGSENAFAGEGTTRLEAQVLGDFHVLGAGIVGMLGHRQRLPDGSGTWHRTMAGVDFGSELLFGFGLKMPLPWLPELITMLEFRGSTGYLDPLAEATTAFEGELGFRYTLGDVTLTGAIGRGFTGGVGEPAVRSVLGLAWAPRVHDQDHDGILDDQDGCPPLPEDVDQFEDSDGCPDPDNDNDLIPDADDRCPNAAAEEGSDEDEDGCTDPVQDGDSDGIADAQDACPGEAEDADDHDDADGCPDPDNDGDTVADGEDLCRDEAEDRDGFRDADGCPDADNDGDGVGDADDRCPNEAEDADSHDDADGCPDPDDDHDGVLDAADRCADRAETINGVTDADGCPDTGGRALWRVTGAAATPAMRITGALTFGADGTLAAASAPAVAQLALVVLAHSPAALELRLPAGHEHRADAVRQALTALGVPAPRVPAVTVDATLRGTRAVLAPVAVTLPASPGPAPAPTPAAAPAPAPTPVPTDGAAPH